MDGCSPVIDGHTLPFSPLALKIRLLTISAPPCWRPNCSDPATCNAGVKCSVYQQHVKQFGEGSEDFIRAMLATGPFVAQNRFAYLNELTQQFGCDVPADYPLPPRPQRTRRGVNKCCTDRVFQNRGCKGGRRCRNARD